MALRALAEALDAADEQYDGSSASASVSGLSASELRTLRAVMAACCAVSMASCGFILFHHFQFTRRSGGARAATIVPRMVVALSVIDFGFSFPKVFGVPDNAALCKTQAFVLQLAGMFCTFRHTGISSRCFVNGSELTPTFVCSVCSDLVERVHRALPVQEDCARGQRGAAAQALQVVPGCLWRSVAHRECSAAQRYEGVWL